MNQWRSPPEWAGPSGYISGHFAIESSDLFSYSDDCKIFTLRDSKPSPLNKPCSGSRPLSARLSSPLPSCLQRLWSSGSPAAIQFRGSRRSESSEPTQVEPPRASLSPHTEVSPVLFAHPDQRSFAASNDLVSFGESECGNMDDSISLAASDAEELLGSSHEPAPCSLHSPVQPAHGRQTDMHLV